MSKDPAFLFYPNDYIGGTMGMTFEEKGAYMELLMLQFNRGHMSEDIINQVVGQLWNKLKDKFEVDDHGLYFNQRLEQEKLKRKKYTSSRKNNIKGNNQYTTKKLKPQQLPEDNSDSNYTLLDDISNIPLTEIQLSERLEEVSTELLNSSNLIYSISEYNKITEDEAKEWINKYLVYTRGTEEYTQSLKAIKKHCANWINIKIFITQT